MEIKQIDENYSVDEMGNVYSRPRLGTKGGMLTPIVSKTGYHVVMLAPSRRPVKVHHLVAMCFMENPDCLPILNHKDGNKLNNAVDNLEWCTFKQNSQHASAMGLLYDARGENSPTAKLTREQVEEIRARYTPRCRVNGARAIARDLNVEKTTVLSVVHRKSWTN